MKRIGVSMRVDETDTERRDVLDQAWIVFLSVCGFLPVLIPNHSATAKASCQALEPDGILLTGGNSLTCYGGMAPERDQIERALVEWAIQKQHPLLGICRGMQLIQDYFGVRLTPVPDQVQARQTILIHGQKVDVNSYHEWGSYETVPELKVWAQTEDGVIKAIQHQTLSMAGIMWHPERMQPFTERDISFFQRFFNGLDYV